MSFELFKSRLPYLTVLVFSFLVAGTACPGQVDADDSQGQSTDGTRTVRSLVTLFSSWSGDEPDPVIFSRAGQLIDYRSMAGRCLGKSWWDKMNPAQRSDFVSIFQRLVENRYYPRWRKLFYRGKLVYLREARAGEDTFVKTILTVGKSEDTVIWRMHSAGGRLKVVSLAVDEKDLVQRLNKRFAKHLARKGIDGVIGWMKDKLDEDDDQPAEKRYAVR